MPFIDQNRLTELYGELEELAQTKEELRQGYIELKLQNIKELNNKKKALILAVSLLLITLLLSVFLFTPKDNTQNDTMLVNQLDRNNLEDENTPPKEEKLLISTKDSLNPLDTAHVDADDKKATDLVYVVQIGVYRHLDVNIESKLYTGLKKIKNHNGTYSYVLGEFEERKDAVTFKSEVVKLGIKDAFVVAVKNNKILEQPVSDVIE